METKLSREDRIKQKTLKIQIVGPYMTAMSILFALFAFTLGTSIYEPFYKLGIMIILLVAMIAIYITYIRNQADIDEIFKD